MRLAIVCVCCLVVSGSSARGDGLGPELTVRLEPTATSYAHGYDVEMVVTVMNQIGGCTPSFIDAWFTRFEYKQRPGSLVRFRVVDQKGKEIAPSEGPEEGIPTQLLPAELIRLSCGTFYGHRFPLARGSLIYGLKAGRYRVQVTVMIGVRRFLMKHLTLLDRLADERRLPRAEIEAELGEGELRSNEVEIEVRAD